MTIEHLTPDAQSALTSIARLFLMNTLEVEATDDRVFNVADLLAETLNTAITHAHGTPAYTNSQVIMSALKACDLYFEEDVA